jgi:hypothetical protein
MTVMSGTEMGFSSTSPRGLFGIHYNGRKCLSTLGTQQRRRREQQWLNEHSYAERTRSCHIELSPTGRSRLSLWHQIGITVTLSIWILEVFGSNLGQATGKPELDLCICRQ